MKKLFLLLLLTSQFAVADSWKEDLQSWKDSRVKSLTRPHGWLSLIGMEWFHNGDTKIGSASDNDIVLPHGPEYIGIFKLENDSLSFTTNEKVLGV